ncbi:hypothetical protein GGF31_003263 [Allomyces arbusculus]|nr:hypothetical protein GGF31_003263 [Allomyces arbusculus]
MTMTAIRAPRPAAAPALRRASSTPTMRAAGILATTLLAVVALLAASVYAHSVDSPNEDLLRVHLVTRAPTLAVVRSGATSAHTPLHKRAVPMVHHDDHLRLTVPVDGNLTYTLHLEPDTKLVHPDARVTVHRADPKTGELVATRTPLVGRVYVGHAVRDGTFGGDRYHARAVLYHDGLSDDADYDPHYATTRVPLFDARFDTPDGDTIRVMPVHVYHRTKRANDPHVPSLRARASTEDALAAHVMYRESDTRGGRMAAGADPLTSFLAPRGLAVANAGECGNGLVGWNIDYRAKLARERNLVSANRLGKRAASTLCPSDASIVYMGVAADCAYTATFKDVEKDILNNILTQWGIVSDKYQATFNVGLGVVATDVRMDCGGPAWNVACGTLQIQDRLSAFSQWRGTVTTSEALWHLLSSCNTGSTLGIAWTGTLCLTTTRSQPSTTTSGATDSVNGCAVSTPTRDQWKVIAHEIGHNFGAIHDCIAKQCTAGTDVSALQCSPCTNSTTGSNCDCGGMYIMNPTDNAISNDFSPGSITDICNNVVRVQRSSAAKSPFCLVKPGSQKTIQGNVCGNGIVEEGEQCDCGTQCANDNCCTSQCTFKSGAVCSDRNSPACCSSCQYKAKGSVCRAARDVCDTQETCSGTSADCPNDTYLADGTSCTLNGTWPADVTSAVAYCASGICSNRNAQCYLASKGTRLVTGRECASQASSCTVACADPSASATCILYDSQFYDGTACGSGGGRCSAGNCVGGSALVAIKNWINDNKVAAIIIGVVIGAAVLAILYSCIVAPLYRKYTRRRAKVIIPPPALAGSASSPAATSASTRPARIQRLASHSPPRPSAAPAMAAVTAPSAPAPVGRADSTTQLINDQTAYLMQNVVAGGGASPPTHASAPPQPIPSPHHGHEEPVSFAPLEEMDGSGPSPYGSGMALYPPSDRPPQAGTQQGPRALASPARW